LLTSIPLSSRNNILHLNASPRNPIPSPLHIPARIANIDKTGLKPLSIALLPIARIARLHATRRTAKLAFYFKMQPHHRYTKRIQRFMYFLREQ
jgi:hypothetical protein